MRGFYIFNIIFFSIIQTTFAQKSIGATVIDANSQKTIPFVSIEFNKSAGVVSNDEGKFLIHVKKKLSTKDSLHISFLGYETQHIALTTFKDSIIKLKPTNFELDEVIVLNKKYTIDEIITKVSENLSKNHTSNSLKSKLFFRESTAITNLKTDVEVKKTSIPELNQKFIDSIIYFMPKKDEIYTEMLGDFYTYSDEKNNKLALIKASKLYNNKNQITFENIEEKLNTILKKHIKRDSYFKVKSGFFGVKTDIDPTLFNDADKEESEKMLAEKKKREMAEKNSFLTNSKASIVSLKQESIINEDSKLNFITKPKKYIYELLDCISMGDDFVYKINFTPKSNADYKGVLYINTDDFAVIRADFENVNDLKSFGLLGVSYKQNLHKGTFIYSLNKNGTYNLKYAEDIVALNFNVKRPLKIIEKNKNVRGRRK